MANAVQDTLDLVRKAQETHADAIAKSISTGTGLVAYDLQAPAKNLYPVNTPIRNRIPRVGGGVGLATNWRVVKAIVGSGYDSMPWVPEGQRSGRMSYVTENKAAAFVTLGEEDSITYEARNAARTFEDLQATMVVRLLQKMMLKEELAIIGGHGTVKLNGGSACPTPGHEDVTDAAETVSDAAHYCRCVPLTCEGYAAWRQGSSLKDGLVQSKTITGADGKTYDLNGGCGKPSAETTHTPASGKAIKWTVTAVPGAVAYAWYIGTTTGDANLYLQAITTTNVFVQTAAPVTSNRQKMDALTDADYSANSMAFDGLIASACATGSGAYVKSLDGATLTASGRGSITQIDAMLKAMWDSYQVSPSLLFCNSQEIQNITAKVLADGGSGTLLRYFTSPESGARSIAAGGGIEYYYNPFTAIPGGQKIPVLLHPNLPAGTIVGWSDNLPEQYKSSQVPNCVEMLTRQDYYQINWPQVTRAQDVGVYAEEVLSVYAPFATAVLSNIADG